MGEGWKPKKGVLEDFFDSEGHLAAGGIVPASQDPRKTLETMAPIAGAAVVAGGLMVTPASGQVANSDFDRIGLQFLFDEAQPQADQQESIETILKRQELLGVSEFMKQNFDGKIFLDQKLLRGDVLHILAVNVMREAGNKDRRGRLAVVQNTLASALYNKNEFKKMYLDIEKAVKTPGRYSWTSDKSLQDQQVTREREKQYFEIAELIKSVVGDLTPPEALKKLSEEETFLPVDALFYRHHLMIHKSLDNYKTRESLLLNTLTSVFTSAFRRDKDKMILKLNIQLRQIRSPRGKSRHVTTPEMQHMSAQAIQTEIETLKRLRDLGPNKELLDNFIKSRLPYYTMSDSSYRLFHVNSRPALNIKTGDHEVIGDHLYFSPK